MKSLLIACLMLTSGFAFAAGSASSYPRTYLTTKKIPTFWYQDAAGCQEDGGEWDGDEDGGICFLDASDELTFSKDADGKLNLSVGVIGTNGHSCDFEGEAKQIKPTVFTASAEGEDYNHETEQFDKVTCTVTVKLSNRGREASLTNNGKCSSFCGARAYLEIEGAKLQTNKK